MIKGVSMQNFMSYVNAYVPLKPGLNLICGPNGAGKSSILLAISLVLGQTYTERARRLSDLIRWGEDEARLTLTIENRDLEGKRLFPRCRSDTVNITRVLKRRGDHYYLIDGRMVNKSEVAPAFRKAGLNPDNALIIMHQLMLGKFGSTSPQDKLKMLEEAAGFQAYRDSILEAQAELKEVVGEERRLLESLESTEQTREHWRREYEKLLRKRSLEEEIKLVKREIAWARVEKKELALASVESKLRNLVESTSKAEVAARSAGLNAASTRRAYEDLLEERKRVEGLLFKLVEERGALTALSSPHTAGNGSAAEKPAHPPWEDVKKRLGEVEAEIESLEKKIGGLEMELRDAVDRLVKFTVEREVESFKLTLLREEEKRLEAQRSLLQEDVQALTVKAEQEGPRVGSPRSPFELMLKLSSLETALKPLSAISDQVEAIYRDYSKVADDLKAKSEEVKKSREALLKELSVRRARWKAMMDAFLSKLNDDFNQILRDVGGVGEVKILNPHDVEKAGLDILVGFKGGPLTSINALTQSGGERSIALMAFLLALQRTLPSPLRGIDEFDVHLDPRNRDLVTRLIVASSRSMVNEQYIAITPGRVRLPDEHVHVIVVQNVEGSSMVMEEAD